MMAIKQMRAALPVIPIVLLFFILKNPSVLHSDSVLEIRDYFSLPFIIVFLILSILSFGLSSVNSFGTWLNVIIVDMLICALLGSFRLDFLGRDVLYDLFRFFTLHSLCCVLYLSLFTRSKSFAHAKYKKMEYGMSLLSAVPFVCVTEYGELSEIAFVACVALVVSLVLAVSAVNMLESKNEKVDRGKSLVRQVAIMTLAFSVSFFCHPLGVGSLAGGFVLLVCSYVVIVFVSDRI